MTDEQPNVPSDEQQGLVPDVDSLGLSDEQWYDIAQAHAVHDWNGPGYLDAIKSVGRAVLVAYEEANDVPPGLWTVRGSLTDHDVGACRPQPRFYTGQQD